MEYFIALVIGYFNGTNSLIEKRIKTGIIGYEYADQWARLLSKLGSLGSLLATLVSAYFVSTAVGNDFADGLRFLLIVFLGGVMSVFTQISSLNYAISAFTVIVNPILAIVVYYITQWPW